MWLIIVKMPSILEAVTTYFEFLAILKAKNKLVVQVFYFEIA